MTDPLQRRRKYVRLRYRNAEGKRRKVWAIYLGKKDGLRRYQRVQRDGSPWFGPGKRLKIIELDPDDIIRVNKAFMNMHYQELEVARG